MAKITQCNLPVDSLLTTDQAIYDYVDAFKMTIEGRGFTSRELATAFMLSPPEWVGVLFKLRNSLAGLIGLKTPEAGKDHKEVLERAKFEPGEKFGLFMVHHSNESEVILGEDDSHLDFRVSLFQRDSSKPNHTDITVSTSVVFNNWVGRTYFLPVKPFHNVIVKSMMNGMVPLLQ